MSFSRRPRRRAAALAAAVVAAAGLVPALAAGSATASAAPSTRYAIYQRVCPAPTTPHTMQCYAIARIDVPKGTPGARPYTPVGSASPRSTGPELARGPAGGFTPGDLASAYGYDPTLKRSSQVVAIIDWHDDPEALADLNRFDRHYGLPVETSTSFRKVNQAGRTAPLPATDHEGSVEIALDVESARGVCRTCRILLVEANGPNDRDLAAAENRAVAMGATEVSNSFGRPEGGESSTTLAAYNHPGVVITASTGDDGWFGWDFTKVHEHSQDGAAFPSTDPNVVAVGATALALGSSGQRVREDVWNENGPEDKGKLIGATGGGCSRSFAGRLAQKHFPGYSATGCAGQRLAADVAAVGDPQTGFDIYDTFGPANFPVGWATVGGTSLAAPVTAALFALAGGSGGAAYPATTIYTNARVFPSSVFDIVNGDVAVNSGTTGSGFCGGVSPTACGTYLKTKFGTHNPNDLVFKSDGAPEGLLDCSWPHRRGDIVVLTAASRECNTAAGFDGPTGVGTPTSLRLFMHTNPAVPWNHSPSLVRLHSPQTLRATATEPAGVPATISSYSWTFGDGHTGSGATVSHTYGTAGRYPVKLTVLDSLYQLVVKQTTLAVGEHAAIRYAGPSTLRVHHAGAFSVAGSTTPNTGAHIVRVRWTWGDHTAAATATSAHHTYSRTGTFTVTATITDSSGVQTNAVHTVKVTS